MRFVGAAAFGVGVLLVASASSTRFLAACELGCTEARPCTTTTQFELSTTGMCIATITSDCLVNRSACASGRESARVGPPSAGSTCNVDATFGDGTQLSLTLQFKASSDDCCPNTFEIDPSNVLDVAATKDAGSD